MDLIDILAYTNTKNTNTKACDLYSISFDSYDIFLQLKPIANLDKNENVDLAFVNANVQLKLHQVQLHNTLAHFNL